MKKLISAFIVLLSFQSAKSQLSITPIVNDTQLINYLQGYGLTISNMNISAAPNSIAFFSGNSAMAFGSGIIMSTGVIDSTINDSASAILSTSNDRNGDTDLEQITFIDTYDACIIEFDCVPAYSNLQFDFSFGSEEYNEYVNSLWNDVFAIFISGPDTTGGNYANTNLALVPGTSIPVSVNTINNGDEDWTTGASSGPCENCSYYYDNSFHQSPIALDGFTLGLQGGITVIPGETYHFKIAIADGGDGSFDSQVMFSTNSFRTIAPVSISELNKENKIKLYPNPAKNKFKILSEKTNIDKVEIYSIEGALMKNCPFEKASNSINTESLSKGIYLVHIYSNNEKVIKKLVIE